MSTDAVHHVRWPPERFLWAILDAPGWTRAGEVPAGMLAALEDEVPVAAEDLHAVCAPGTNGVVVCAARRSELDVLGPDVLLLTPASVPEWASQGLDASRLNLLVGAFEPLRLRRAARRAHVIAAATVLLCMAFVCVGFQRRGAVWRFEDRAARDATSAVLRTALPEGGDPAVELERLRRAQAAVSSKIAPSDAAVMLASVLAAWPNRASCSTSSLAVGQDGAALSVVVDGDPTSFLESLTPPPGWTLEEPRLNTGERGTRLSLLLRPAQRGNP